MRLIALRRALFTNICYLVRNPNFQRGSKLREMGGSLEKLGVQTMPDMKSIHTTSPLGQILVGRRDGVTQTPINQTGMTRTLAALLGCASRKFGGSVQRLWKPKQVDHTSSGRPIHRPPRRKFSHIRPVLSSGFVRRPCSPVRMRAVHHRAPRGSARRPRNPALNLRVHLPSPAMRNRATSTTLALLPLPTRRAFRRSCSSEPAHAKTLRKTKQNSENPTSPRPRGRRHEQNLEIKRSSTFRGQLIHRACQ